MKGTDVSVFSQTGNLVLKQKVDSTNSVDVSNLKTGVYLIVANKEGKEMISKILKK
ncbi:MAG: hypothetical protein C0432_05580 [Candidatus Puniceispirillum sp.]|nr:hypothetical protein [Candidatus Puniceispirillum sp.]